MADAESLARAACELLAWRFASIDRRARRGELTPAQTLAEMHALRPLNAAMAALARVAGVPPRRQLPARIAPERRERTVRDGG